MSYVVLSSAVPPMRSKHARREAPRCRDKGGVREIVIAHKHRPCRQVEGEGYILRRRVVDGHCALDREILAAAGVAARTPDVLAIAFAV
eukprot:COSAG02_NODE_18014_length_966_cov_0.854671_3_plen_88_part_01